MVDIAMCCSKSKRLCKRASTCFRALAEPDEYQSVVAFNPDCCDHYWPVTDEQELKQLNEEWK